MKKSGSAKEVSGAGVSNVIGPYYYLLFSSLGLLVAALICKPRRILNLRHFATVFLVVMYMTFVIRPFLAYTVGDGLTTLQYYLPGISQKILYNLDLMAALFSASVICFAIGYSLLSRPDLTDSVFFDQSGNDRRRISAGFGFILVIVGYGSFLIAQRGFVGLAGETIQMQRTASGSVFVNTSGYIEYANYLVVSGVLLYYASTKRLGISLLIALPWTVNQIYFAWYRYMLLVLYFGLFAVWLVSTRHSERLYRLRMMIIMALPLLAVAMILSMRGYRTFWKAGLTPIDAVQSTANLEIDSMLGDLAGFEGSWYMAVTVADGRRPKLGASVVYQYFIKPIPRLIWRSKPLPLEFTWSRVLLNEIDPVYVGPYGYSETVWWNAPVKGSIGYALEEWGWLGIPLDFGLTGLFLAWIERRIARSGASPNWRATYAATYSLIAILGRMDLFLAGLNTVLLFYLPYFFSQNFLGPGKKHTQPIAPEKSSSRATT